jgi:hypothetical protein
MSSTKPVIFISYSHKDEPERPRDGEIQWRRYVQSFLQPAMKNAVIELWSDDEIPGGGDWEARIKTKLAVCDICILLVSRHSLDSDYVIKIEIEAILQRQQGEDVQIYPIVLTPFPRAAAPASLLALNLRPPNGEPLSGLTQHQRDDAMAAVTDEIVTMVQRRASGRATVTPGATASAPSTFVPGYVHIAGLPETAYERLVGRGAGLKRLDEAWEDKKTNIISLIAEGGAGKSALVNEWLKRMQADAYLGAEAVLGWSFYSQGSKERATSAEEFLNWVLDRLGLTLAITSASAKGEAIAEAMMRRRVLLLLDGVEPLQHGPGPEFGKLKDQGLRALLRRFAATPPAQGHGLVVLTSRVAVQDIGRWRQGSAPVVEVERLSDEAGAALLRDNGAWGTDRQLAAAARDFGGHPLALGLLASFLRETMKGDVRQRDHIRSLLVDTDNPGHDHAKRVMESYEAEWLVSQPVAHAIMHMVGLFDRPASDDCLTALRAKPAITGLTDQIVALDQGAWRRAVERLREVRLLAPPDPAAPDALDAHPLVREWFGERLKATNEVAWKAAHGRLYHHLRDTTKEGKTPTLEDLAPLYQAIAHGCRAGRHQEALAEVYGRMASPGNRQQNYLRWVLGASGTELAALSWFFDRPYEMVASELNGDERSYVLAQTASVLFAQTRFAEALPAMRIALKSRVEAQDWINAAVNASNLVLGELIVGSIEKAIKFAEEATKYADHTDSLQQIVTSRVWQGTAMQMAGKFATANALLAEAERRARERIGTFYLPSVEGYYYCDFLLTKGQFVDVKERATQTLSIARERNWIISVALDTVSTGRACLGQALISSSASSSEVISASAASAAGGDLNEAVLGLRTAGYLSDLPRGLVARAAFRRSVGDWDGAARDLDEVEEIAEPGPMRLFLCDMALERARLAFARIETFAPLNELIDDSPSKPERPSEVERKSLQDEAAKQLAIAADYIATCGYHRRDEELAELQAVLAGKRTFASLPPRV